MNYDKNNIMLLIFIEKITNRVGYTLNLIFKDILGVQYNITTNKEAFANYKGPKLSYSKRRLDKEPFIFSKDFLKFIVSSIKAMGSTTPTSPLEPSLCVLISFILAIFVFVVIL